MAQKIVFKKRFINKLNKLLLHLEQEWGQRVADEFIDILQEKLTLVKKQPGIGAITFFTNTRSLLVTKQNKIYYRINNEKIEVINMIDTRRNPSKNPFNKTK